MQHERLTTPYSLHMQMECPPRHQLPWVAVSTAQWCPAVQTHSHVQGIAVLFSFCQVMLSVVLRSKTQCNVWRLYSVPVSSRIATVHTQPHQGGRPYGCTAADAHGVTVEILKIGFIALSPGFGNHELLCGADLAKLPQCLSERCHVFGEVLT